jgi:hypothetical protein
MADKYELDIHLQTHQIKDPFSENSPNSHSPIFWLRSTMRGVTSQVDLRVLLWIYARSRSTATVNDDAEKVTTPMKCNTKLENVKRGDTLSFRECLLYHEDAYLSWEYSELNVYQILSAPANGFKNPCQGTASSKG